jgi:hypothetical protein
VSIGYQCPKTRGSNFVHVAKTYRYEQRAFLWLSWVAEIHTGYIVRCVDHGCARYWRIGLDGVHEPAGHGPPPRAVPPPGANGEADEDRKRPEYGDPLDAVRRIEV